MSRVYYIVEVIALVHVFGSVPVVGYQTDVVFPYSVVAACTVIYQFIDGHRSFRNGAYREASHAYYGFVGKEVCSVGILKEGEVVVGYVSRPFIETLFRLECKEERIVVPFPLFGYVAVVARAVAEEQEVTGVEGCVACRFGTVVEHFHKPAVGRGVGFAGRELVIYQFRAYYNGGDVVVLEGELGQPFGL